LHDEIVDLIFSVDAFPYRVSVAGRRGSLHRFVLLLFLERQPMDIEPTRLAIQAGPIRRAKHFGMVARNGSSAADARLMPTAQDHQACFCIGFLAVDEELPSPNDWQNPLSAARRTQ
jgi:hypothetical protein